jgi:hypothetical protein
LENQVRKDNAMASSKLSRIANLAAVSFIGLTLSSSILTAQSVKIEGLIKARNGDTMTVQTSGSASVPVLLTDDTQVGQVQGLLKARRKDMSMAALIPRARGQSRGRLQRSQ